MADAKYTVAIPTQDTMGNPLKPIGHYAYQWLNQVIRPRQGWVDSGKQMMTSPPVQGDHLVVVAEETPENDSHVKQLAGYVGDVCNHPVIPVLREGKNGMAQWTIPNRLFQPGPAEPLVQASLSLSPSRQMQGPPSGASPVAPH